MRNIFVALMMLSIFGISSLFASEIGGSLNPNISNGLQIGIPCSPSSVSNGSVNQLTCQITCNSGYTLQGQQCTIVAVPSGGGGGGGGIFLPPVNTGNLVSTGVVPSSTGDALASGLPPSSVVVNTSDACSDGEYNLAYNFAFRYGITTMPSCLAADMDGLLIRAHAAKMIANYAMNVLEKTPDTEKICIFGDMQDQTQEMQDYARIACQLGLMGLLSDGITPASVFNPNTLLDKAQFATILSRLLYGPLHDNNSEQWWTDHVAALAETGIITVLTDLFDPLKRGFAMIMLMRTLQ